MAARRRVDFLNSFVHEAEHNADPEDEGLPRHDRAFVGLRNLSATCFVNAILQQLFHLFTMRYLFRTHICLKNSQLLPLQRLFLRMQSSHMPFADPEAFLRQWREWHGELLDPHTSQEASEFPEALLETFPLEISSLFRGPSNDTLTGITARELTAQ
jgi:ubiquitin carboxyl-terminal hydrolase 34